jgi:hypothetical protein
MAGKSKSIAPVAILLAGAAACAPANAVSREDRARAATASAIAGIQPDQIVIDQLTPPAARTTWRAEAGGRVYECDADDQLRLPDCRPVS